MFDSLRFSHDCLLSLKLKENLILRRFTFPSDRSSQCVDVAEQTVLSDLPKLPLHIRVSIQIYVIKTFCRFNIN